MGGSDSLNAADRAIVVVLHPLNLVLFEGEGVAPAPPPGELSMVVDSSVLAHPVLAGCCTLTDNKDVGFRRCVSIIVSYGKDDLLMMFPTLILESYPGVSH